MTVTKEFNFEMAHSLEDYDGACRRIHGHSYRLWVSVVGVPAESGAKQGMVVDFSVLGSIVRRCIVDRFDHAFVIRKTGDNSALIQQMQRHWEGIITVDWQPTSENLVRHFAELLKPELPQGVRLHSLKLSETASSFAELSF